MAHASKELEERLQELGSKLAAPPSAAEELLPLLDQTDGFLSRVEQSPSRSMLTVLRPLMNALVARELLRHLDKDVKVAVASCISEITRITAPDAPYDDDLMKEIFQMIVEAFGQLDDISSPSFSKRVSILETVAKVRSCVVMLDLECDALILEMFHHFLKTIRSNHPENVFSSMETIMTLVIEESEDISSELLSCLLAPVKKDEDVLPIAQKLVEKVMGNCVVKLKPYLGKLVQSMGAPLSEYSKIVASICQESSDALEQNEINASGEILADDSKLSERTVSDELPQVSAKLEQEVGCPEKVGTAADHSPRAVTSNGTVQMGNGDSMEEPISPKLRPERSRRSDQFKNTVAANQADSDNLGSVTVKADCMSDFNTKKVRGRKTNSSIQLTDTTDHSRIDSDKEASAVTSRRKGRSKEADNSQVDPPSGKELESAVCLGPEKKNEVQHLLGSDNATASFSSPTPSASLLDATRPKRGRSSGSKVAAKRNGVNAVSDQPASGQKGSLLNSQTQDEVLPPKDVDSKKETQGVSESEGKPLRHLGKKVHSESDDDGEAPATVISDSEAKPERNTGKRGYKRKVTQGESSGRKQKSSAKQQIKELAHEKDVAGEPTLKEMVSSTAAAMKAPSKDQSHLDASGKMKSRRKRARGTEEISKTPDHKKGVDENLVGSKIKVWWPDDKKFYEGFVKSFDPIKKEHKVVYDDGDTETLLLKKERWEFVEGNTETDGGQVKVIPSTDASEMSWSRKPKLTSNSASKQAMAVTPSKSGTESSGKDEDHVKKRKGRPRGSLRKLANDDSPKTLRQLRGKSASKVMEDTPKTSSKLKEEPGNKSKGDTPKSNGKSKDDTPRTGKVEPPKSSRKSKYDTLKANSKSKDNVPKISSNSRDDAIASNEKTPKTDSKKDDVVSVGSKSNRGTPRVGRKRKGSTTPRTGGVSNVYGTSQKDKTNVQESENTAEGQESGATTGKKRKRKGFKDKTNVQESENTAEGQESGATTGKKRKRKGRN